MKPDPCPDNARLQRLLAGALPDTERVELSHHVEACGACQRTAELLSGATGAWAPAGASPAPATPAPASEPIPTAPEGLGTLGSYQIVARLDGDRGLLLKAFEPRLQRHVAIRLLPPELAGDPEARQRFARTARSAASIDHENVVTIHAVNEAAPQPYQVTEFVAGTTLGERLTRPEQMAWKEVLRLGQQVAAGVAAIHRGGLVHGNIGLATVLLEEGTGRVKLTDFGLGIASGPDQQVTEQARHADLTALGAVLFALCTGQELTEGTDPKRALRSAPPWLRELVLALLAGPGAASPTAAEIAEQLRRQLVALQPAPARARRILSPTERRRRRRLAGGFLLLLLLGGLGVSEAIGTTRLLAIAAPQITGEAKLVIELEDPEARVTLAGYETEMTEPATREISLRPGDYLLRVAQEDQPLKEQRITLPWGGREVVTVPAEPPKVRTRPFVVRSRRGFPQQECATLTDAVRAARRNDVIEIHGDGPFTSPPVTIAGKPLTIRAAKGFRPVFEFEHMSGQGTFIYLSSNAALVLEGVELRIEGTPKWEPGYSHVIARVTESPFHVLHCKFLVKGTGVCLQAIDAPECVVRNSELIRARGTAHETVSIGSMPNAARIEISDSVLAGGHWGVMMTRKSPTVRDVSVRLHGNTVVARVPLIFSVYERDLPAEDGKGPALTIDATGNVFDTAEDFFRFNLSGYKADEKVVTAEQAEAWLSRLVRWQMRDNLLPEGVSLLHFVQALHQPLPGARDRQTLAEWDQFWKLPPRHSLQNRPSFAGEELATRHAKTGEAVTAADFKLQPESPGRGLGPDRKDLGARVDEVGPGPAYQRWKKTPEYQEWLKKTGQTP